MEAKNKNNDFKKPTLYSGDDGESLSKPCGELDGDEISLCGGVYVTSNCGSFTPDFWNASFRAMFSCFKRVF